MTLKQTFNKYFNSHSETSDNHWDPNLKTHYFKTTQEKGMQAVEALFTNAKEFEIVASSKDHGEISVIYKGGRKAFVTATIIMVRPYRTAIDLSVTLESAFPPDFGYSHKLIPKLYKILQKELTLLDRTS
ncbi:cytosolic protein [Radiobacillus sp. PE A8.2]|uniref:cytosolic protein n=1 Tax=Radiobacillus sp. PE A8.2 TaxID=3380349 RepID=UPI00388DB8D3